MQLAPFRWTSRRRALSSARAFLPACFLSARARLCAGTVLLCSCLRLGRELHASGQLVQRCYNDAVLENQLQCMQQWETQKEYTKKDCYSTTKAVDTKAKMTTNGAVDSTNSRMNGLTSHWQAANPTPTFPPPSRYTMQENRQEFSKHPQSLKAHKAAPSCPAQQLQLVRRTKGVKFDLGYPKTGGGEDVAFCLDLQV